MDDEIQDGLARKIEEIVKASQKITGGRVREVKVSPGGGITIIMNDERRYPHCMGEFPMSFEDPDSVADLNISLKNKLKDSELEAGKYIRQITDMQICAKKAEEENMIMREENIKLRKAGEAAQRKINGLQNDIKNLRGMVSKGRENYEVGKT